MLSPTQHIVKINNTAFTAFKRSI